MGFKTTGDPESFTPQFFDAEVVNTASTDSTPTKQQFACGLYCLTAGTPTVDFYGINGQGALTNQALTAMVAGQIFQFAISKVHKTGTTGTYLYLY